MSDLISRDEVLSLLPGGQSCDPQAIADAVRSLSTRQQQGADTTDYKALWKAAELHCAQALRERDEALSRAPQPDTVTEEMVDAALKAYGNGWVSAADHRQHTFEPMKAAITAALNAKGK